MEACASWLNIRSEILCGKWTQSVRWMTSSSLSSGPTGGSSATSPQFAAADADGFVVERGDFCGCERVGERQVAVFAEGGGVFAL